MNFLTPNNTRNRWQHVFKTYSKTDKAPILFDVALFALALTGNDAFAASVKDQKRSYNIGVWGPREVQMPLWQRRSKREDGSLASPTNPLDADYADDDTPGSQLFLMGLNQTMHSTLPDHHPGEKLIPWVASKLSRLYRQEQRGAKTLGVIWNPDDWRGDEGTYRDQENRPREWNETVNRLAAQSTSIANWAEAEGVDIGKVDLREALEGAVDYRARSRDAAREGSVVAELSDGWRVEELRERKELEEEGSFMDHCVGSYHTQVASGDVHIYSLRDPEGKSFATFEWEPDEQHWEQIMGEANGRPAEESHKYIEEFVESFVPPGATEPQPESATAWYKGPNPKLIEAAREADATVYEYSGDGPLEGAGSVSWGDLEPISWNRLADLQNSAGAKVIVVPGSHGNDLVSEANRTSMLRDHEDNPSVFAVGNGVAVGVNAHSSDSDLADLILSCDDGVYDEGALTTLEHEKEDEAWESYVEDDAKREVTRALDDEDEEVVDEVLDFLSDQGLFIYGFLAAAESANVYWENEYDDNGRTIDVDRVMQDYDGPTMVRGLFGYYGGSPWSAEMPEVAQKIASRIGVLIGAARRPTPLEMCAIVEGIKAEGIEPRSFDGDDRQMSLMDYERAQRLDDTLDAAGLARGVVASMVSKMEAEGSLFEYAELAGAYCLVQSTWVRLHDLNDDSVEAFAHVIVDELPALNHARQIVEAVATLH